MNGRKKLMRLYELKNKSYCPVTQKNIVHLGRISKTKGIYEKRINTTRSKASVTQVSKRTLRSRLIRSKK